MASAIKGTFLIDAHVHCHQCFAQSEFLDHAWRSCSQAARELDVSGRAIGWLLFAALPDDHYFEALRTGQIADAGQIAGAKWRVVPTAEKASLVTRQDDGQTLILIAGRQMTTKEGLEVLGLGTTGTFADGQSLTATVAAVRDEGAIAVVPWGFGKWWSRRGRLVSRFVDSTDEGGVFLGDNGGRPAGFSPPRQFAEAARRGIFVLPGSDPLPLPTEAQRVARYGLVLEGAVDAERPVAGLFRLFAGLDQQPPTFGRLPGLGACLAKQSTMQWRKLPAAPMTQRQ